MKAKPITLYGIPFNSIAEAMNYWDIPDYQQVDWHRRRSAMGLHYVSPESIKPRKRDEKYQYFAEVLKKNGFWKD